jgi:ribonuclease D
MIKDMFPERITKEEVNLLPIGKYDGEIKVISDFSEFPEAMAHVFRHKVIGFDTETRPAFQKGQYFPVSLLQIALPDMVYLFRLKNLGLPPSLVQLFSDENIMKVGISIRDDIKDLQKLTPFKPEGIVEINALAKQLGILNEGVRNLSAIFLGIRISKTEQTSNWDKEELTDKQINYAATDAWVCLEIYNMLVNKGYIEPDISNF